MANKIETVMAALATGMQELVTAGDLKGFHRAVINPLNVHNTPVAAMVVDRLARDGATWTADVLIQVAMTESGEVSDSDAIEMVAKLEAKIAAVRATGTAGGRIDKPVFDLWYTGTPGGALRRVGAVGGLRVQVESPLLT